MVKCKQKNDNRRERRPNEALFYLDENIFIFSLSQGKMRFFEYLLLKLETLEDTGGQT